MGEAKRRQAEIEELKRSNPELAVHWRQLQPDKRRIAPGIDPLSPDPEPVAAIRGDGSALPIASRTIRRCTPSFLVTPTIVPTPNSYSRRISSNSSTLALQSNESPDTSLRRSNP